MTSPVCDPCSCMTSESSCLEYRAEQARSKEADEAKILAVLRACEELEKQED